VLGGGGGVGEEVGVLGVLHEEFQQIFERVFVGFSFGAAVASGFGDIDDPGGFVALVGNLFVVLIVVEAVGLDEIEEQSDELTVLHPLDDRLGRHRDVIFVKCYSQIP
jgi:predicted acylesterase/phospholipase RssA